MASAMEFARVDFDSEREVYVDGAPVGVTNETFALMNGMHQFSLGEPVDYTPPVINAAVRGTDAEKPLVVTFTPTVAPLGPELEKLLDHPLYLTRTRRSPETEFESLPVGGIGLMCKIVDDGLPRYELVGFMTTTGARKMALEIPVASGAVPNWIIASAADISWRHAISYEYREPLWRDILRANPNLLKMILAAFDEAAEDEIELATLVDEFKGERWISFAIARAAEIALLNSRPLEPVHLLAAFLVEANSGSDTDSALFVLQWLSEQHERPAPASRTESVLQVLELPKRASVTKLGAEGIVGSLQMKGNDAGFIRAIAEKARAIAENASNTTTIDTRHVLAVLLQPDGITSVVLYLQDLSVEVDDLRHDLFGFITTTHATDDIAAWRELLLVPLPFDIRNTTTRDMWTREDTLGYGLYAKAIAAPIINGTTEAPLTIGIQAPWGQGKTSLMRMIQAQLDPEAPKRETSDPLPPEMGSAIRATYQQVLRWIKETRPESSSEFGMLHTKTRVPTVWFNPLYYRETSQVWAGMAHAILQQLTDQLEPPEREKFWLQLQLSRINAQAIRRDVHEFLMKRAVPVGLFVLAVSAIFLVLATIPGAWAIAGLGGALSGAATYVWRWLTTIDRPFDKYVTEPNYQTELGLLHLVDHDLDRALRLLIGTKGKIGVFIDDLDRCDPATVNQVILAINQFLSLSRRNAFFFLGMDMDMVAAALEKAQNETGGPTIGGSRRRSFGWRFMEKFVQLPFVIPHLDDETAKRFATEYLRGKKRSAGTETTNAVIAQVRELSTATAVGRLARRELAKTLDPADRARLQAALSEQATKLIEDPKGDEIQRIVDIAVVDLDLNPRTIKRYFCLVRVLRNIQIATGRVKDPDVDRRIVLRAAHLLLNWPQFVQWLLIHPEMMDRKKTWRNTVDEIESILDESPAYADWTTKMVELLGDSPPPHIQDVTLYRYLRKLATDTPRLKDLYAARMF